MSEVPRVRGSVGEPAFDPSSTPAVAPGDEPRARLPEAEPATAPQPPAAPAPDLEPERGREAQPPSRTTTVRLSRRALLGWILGGVAVGAAAGAGLTVLLRDEGGEGGGALDDETRAAVERIGREYLRAYPDEADAATLLAGLPAIATIDEVPARFRALGDAVTADFTAGRTVLLDGWLLSRTEARAAALVALDAERGQ